MAEILNEPTERLSGCDHLVQVYRDPVELAEAVATFFAAGFEAAEPAVAVVAAPHWPAIRERLEKRGWNVEALQADGTLVVRDAAETLAAISEAGVPSSRLFREVIGGVLDEASRGRGVRVRAFGEMVDLLVRAGDSASADRLEGFWNDLASRRRFTLLCGYRVDLFDVGAHTALLPQVYRSHTHVLPPVEAERIETAVNRALADILGESDTQKVYAQVELHVGDRGVSPAQLALMWLSAHMPRTAEQVLAAAQTHFATA
jgi:DcmR-like sensory protein